MSPEAFLLSSLLCAFSFAVAEIPPRRWVTQHRRPDNHLPRYDRQSNTSNPDGRSFGYYDTRPIYRYDYGLSERSHPSRHYGQKIERNDGRPYTTGIYRTYGKGKAIIPKMGATVSVSNSVPRRRVHKGTITARVMTPSLSYNEASPRVVTRNRRQCMGCPQNRAVVASRGNAHVILPEPCPTLRWMPISGPRPGTLIAEGTHSLIGRLGQRGKICQYEYEVVVRHCGTFTVESGNANCTIDDAWGSTCMITCEDGYELVGSPILVCSDDLKWSNPPPVCKKKKGCPLPQTPDNVKIWCQVPDESDLTDDNLPAETYCRFKADGKQRVITCVEGYWVKKHGRGKRNHRTVKSRKNKKVANNDVNWKKEIDKQQHFSRNLSPCKPEVEKPVMNK